LTSSTASVAPIAVGAAAISAGAVVLASSSQTGDIALPSSAAFQASRFLAQATFGPNDTLIASVQTLRIEQWITQQADTTQTPSPTQFVAWINRREAELRAANNNRGHASHTQFQEAFWASVISDPDQLRQRMAFALSQIMVVSFKNAEITPRIGAAYWDLLRKYAFGNYVDLLKAVTLSGAMGIYLNIVGNAEADKDPSRHPDENYAREILQLMSIGLYQLNPDGSPVLDAAGQPVATYSHDDIAGLAKVFTGLGWRAKTPTDKSFRRPTQKDADIQPLMVYPQYHSRLSKTFLGQTLPALTTANPTDAEVVDYQLKELDAALGIIASHPNVGPFLGRRLIQRFVKSNPSPDYIRRVATAFNDNGKGVRGDLLATITAVLTDTEARPFKPGAFDGKLREPTLRLSMWYRALGAASASGSYLQTGDLSSPTSLNEAPLEAATVFNFWTPDYAPPGSVIQAAGKVAPEFQAVDVLTTASYALRIINLIMFGNIYGDLSAKYGDIANKDVSTKLAHEVRLTDAYGLVAPQPLIARLNLLFCGGQMSAALTRRITDVVNSTTPTSRKPTAKDIAAVNLKRVQNAVTLTMVSTDFLIQR